MRPLPLPVLLVGLVTLLTPPPASTDPGPPRRTHPIAPSLLARLRAAAPGSRLPLLVRLVEPDLAAAAPSAYGRPLAALGPDERVDLRRRLAARARDESPFADPRYPGLWVANAVAVDAEPATALAWLDDPRVESISEDLELPFLPPPAPGPAAPAAGSGRWGVVASGAAALHRRFGWTGHGVRIGHIDTGVDARHPQLAGKIAAFRDFLPAPTKAPSDPHGHGTHTLGIMVAGRGDDSVAPDARAVVARALDAKGNGRLGALLAALQWMLDPDGDPATRDRPAVVNASWGVARRELTAKGVDDRLFWDAVKALRDADIVPVFSAGNEGPGAELVPAGYPHALAVGAFDSAFRVAGFSSGGPIAWSGERFGKPDLTAPGVGVVSTYPGDRGIAMDGTSQAAPHVAGLVALLRGGRPRASAKDVERALLESAVDRGEPGRDFRYGQGSVDGLAAALRLGGTAAPPPPVPPSPPPARPRGRMARVALGLAALLGAGFLLLGD